MNKELSPRQREELLNALSDRFEKNLNRQTLDVANKTRSTIFGWRGQFTPEFAARDLREAVSRIFSPQSL